MTRGEFSAQIEGTTIASQRLNTSETISWFLYSPIHSIRLPAESERLLANAFSPSVSTPRSRPQIRSLGLPDTLPKDSMRWLTPFAGMCVPM